MCRRYGANTDCAASRRALSRSRLVNIVNIYLPRCVALPPVLSPVPAKLYITTLTLPAKFELSVKSCSRAGLLQRSFSCCPRRGFQVPLHTVELKPKGRADDDMLQLSNPSQSPGFAGQCIDAHQRVVYALGLEAPRLRVAIACTTLDCLRSAPVDGRNAGASIEARPCC